MHVIVFDPHALADPEVDFTGLLDDQRASRVETQGDPIARTVHPLVQLLTGERSADAAGDRRGRVAAAAADLVADDAARDAAQHRAGVALLVLLAVLLMLAS